MVRNSGEPTLGRVFITHSSMDHDLAELVVQAIRRSTGILDENVVFCSSVEGSEIPTGDDFVRYIQQQLSRTRLVVPLITPAYLDSEFCAWELGAAWVRKVAIHPILVDAADPSELPLLLRTRQVDKLSHAGFRRLAERVAKAVQTSVNDQVLARETAELFSEFPSVLNELKQKWPKTALARQRRKARVGEAASVIHQVHHTLRDVTYAMMQQPNPDNIGSYFWDLLHHTVDHIRQAFDITTGLQCRATVKQLVPNSKDPIGDQTFTNLAVRDFARSPESLRNRTSVDLIRDNSDFEKIYLGYVNYFSCNDIPAAIAAGKYRNSHMTGGRALAYKSAIVWPIRKITSGSSEYDHDLIGFLCVDCNQVGAFDAIDAEIGASFADSLYALRPYMTRNL